MEYLPAEITSQILRQNDDSHIARILSKNSKITSQADFLETTCRKNISLNEIIKYIAKDVTYGYILVPKILHHGSVDIFHEFYVWTPYPWGRDVGRNNDVYLTHIPTVYINYAIMGGDTDLEIITDENLRLDNYVDDRGDGDLKMVEFTTQYKMEDNTIYNTVIEDYNNIKLFDLLTIYRILKNREACVDTITFFAYNETLRIFHQFIDTHNTMVDLLTLFGYLYINMKVMNLPYSGPTISNRYSHVGIDKNYIDNNIINNYWSYIDETPSMISNIEKYLYVIYQYDNII